jgi:hypothetical protein
MTNEEFIIMRYRIRYRARADAATKIAQRDHSLEAAVDAMDARFIAACFETFRGPFQQRDVT